MKDVIINKKSKIDILKKEIINLIIKKEYRIERINEIEKDVKKFDDKELNNSLADLYNNWGIHLGYLAKTKEYLEADNLYKEAFEKFKIAIDIKPDDYESFNNWGTYLGDLANTKEGIEADNLYKQAIEKFKKVIEIKPDDYDALYSWGTNLGNLAMAKEGIEADNLYKEAFEKFKKVIEIKPDDYETFDNWGTYLTNLAKIKEGVEADNLHKEAIEKFKMAIEYGADSYDLSCIFALKGDIKNALKYLNIALSNEEISVDFVKENEDWKNYLEDKDFITLLERYNNK
jgi:tetratricopeptide (TPR) repeat protein